MTGILISQMKNKNFHTLMLKKKAVTNLYKKTNIKNKYFSTKENSSNISMHFKENILFIWLPPISDKNEFLKSLEKILNLLNLDKNFFYKLEFSLFLHTNDSNKDVVFHLPPSELDPSKLNIDNMRKLTLAMSILYKQYNFRGYYIYHTEAINFPIDFEYYLNNIYNGLGDSIISTNEDLDIDGFIEFNKYILLKVYRKKKDS